MARYSFCVIRKSNPTEALYLKGKYDLPFLVCFAAQFNNQKELLKFLGLNPNEYKSIEIGYKVEKTFKFLPIYFDAPIIVRIGTSMVDFTAFEECGNVYEEIALAYRNPKLLKTSKIVPETREVYTIIDRTLKGPKPSEELINDAALEHYLKYNQEFYQRDGDSDFHRDKFAEKLREGFIQIYKAYIHLRANGLMQPEVVNHQVPNYTMQEIIDSYGKSGMTLIYDILEGMKLTEYEEIIISRIIRGDEDAYEELMANDAERLEYLRPILPYLAGRRGNVRKIGTID